jgi:indole-3-glycerol phosphate synthase
LILDRILSKKREEIKSKKTSLPLKTLKKRLDEIPATLDFKAHISRGRDSPINLIAEIKHISPLKGVLRRRFDPISLAKDYANHKVSAISVLTDKPFFGGEISHLRMVKKAVSIPVLRKDFIIDPYQIFESRINGADALLLISSILSKDQLLDLLALVEELGMDAVVEVHTERDLDEALAADAKIIGINNRNLYTFAVDLKTTLRLRLQIPSSKIIISESGIKSRDDILLLEDKGVDAALVGEAILRSEDVGQKIDELLGLR